MQVGDVLEVTIGESVAFGTPLFLCDYSLTQTIRNHVFSNTH